MILFLPRCFRRYSATSIPSLVMRSTVIVDVTEGPVFLSVLPTPLWSHCTTVKYFSHGAKNKKDQGLVTSPGPPCRNSSTSYLRGIPEVRGRVIFRASSKTR